MSFQILIVSPAFVVAVKPFGALSEDDGSPDCMPALLRAAGITTPYPVHRLDRTTEGLMLWAKTREAAAILSEEVRTGAFSKIYRALITASPDLPPSGEMHDFLYFDRRRDKAFVVSGERKGAKEAVLRYSLGTPFDWRGHLLTPARVELLTGRTHQIRVQFAARQSPLAGDGKYGSRLNYKGPALICEEISFSWEGEPVTIRLPDLPD
ncbi:MAG: RluA family pseudouridine synthase [Clostridiales bacterium]|nr:RluA family pseudouridine synthase [Clostridiales bacterium]